MISVSDNTSVDLSNNNLGHQYLSGEAQNDNMGREDIHATLMAAGFVPGFGNIADAIDALLYLYEGEYGEAAISAAAMVPFIGQTVSAKKALQAAKESGEKMVTIYRGADKWHKGTMVKDGKFISSGDRSTRFTVDNKGNKTSKKVFYTSVNKNTAESYGPGRSNQGVLLEFEVPESYMKEHALNPFGKNTMKKTGDLSEYPYYDTAIFEDGLPKEFLKKVHK